MFKQILMSIIWLLASSCMQILYQPQLCKFYTNISHMQELYQSYPTCKKYTKSFLYAKTIPSQNRNSYCYSKNYAKTNWYKSCIYTNYTKQNWYRKCRNARSIPNLLNDWSPTDRTVTDLPVSKLPNARSLT